MRRLPVLFSALLLAACSTDHHEDLQEWMNSVALDAKGKIQPLPVVEPYEPVPYDASNLIDPFRPSKMAPEEKRGGGGAFRPDPDRPKEPLEAYPLESLRYVGVMTRNKASHALILVDGSLYQVRIGNYMGQNFGVIVGVSESEVTLRELIQDSAGDWVERTSSLLLQEKGAK